MNQIKLVFDNNRIHQKNHKNAIVVLSGGIDSTVALWWALDSYKNVDAIIVDYNQDHKTEIDYAKRICTMAKVPYHVISLRIPKTFWAIKNHITRGQAGLMVAIAALNISHEGADIVNGILSTDNIYGDCDRSHLDELASVLVHPNDNDKIGIATPLCSLKDKKEVIAFGFILGAPLDKTWSCRNPIHNKPCNNCSQCYERNNAFKEFFEQYKIDSLEFEKWQRISGSPYHPTLKKCNESVYNTILAYLDIHGFTKTTKALKYIGPDNAYHVATHIKNTSHIGKSEKGKYELCDVIAVSGFLENGKRWEICIFEDGTTALTDELPDEKTIRDSLVELHV